MPDLDFSKLPPPLPGAKTYIYKTVGETTIPIDIYTPSQALDRNGQTPLFLFIHGGAWIGGSRLEYCRPLFSEYLERGIIVASMDYRLLPETDFLTGQLEDIRDVEPWLRFELAKELLRDQGLMVKIGSIIVGGSSAGAHLALLTPKLWSTPPAAILSISGPTNMLNIPPITSGFIANIPFPEPTPDFLKSATKYGEKEVPTSTPIPKSFEDFTTPRNMLGMMLFRDGLKTQFLLRGFCSESKLGGELAWPRDVVLDEAEIDEISPLQISRRIRYPPVYMILGDADDLFSTSHLADFCGPLREQGIACEEVLVSGAGHAFEIFADSGGETHLKVVKPVVEWTMAQVR